MKGFTFAWHFIVIFDHLFGVSICADGHVADFSKKLASWSWKTPQMEGASSFETPTKRRTLVLCIMWLECRVNINKLWSTRFHISRQVRAFNFNASNLQLFLLWTLWPFPVRLTVDKPFEWSCFVSFPKWPVCVHLPTVLYQYSCVIFIFL
jgi:hypothetical protein